MYGRVVIKALRTWVFTLSVSCFSQYTEDPTFQRHGLMPVTVLEQATSGLAHLHSLNIGKREIYIAEYQRGGVSHSFNQS